MTALLDLVSVTRREATWRFDLLDSSLKNLGELEVDRGSVPNLSVDTSRAVKRSCSGVTLTPSTIDDVDVISDRIAITMILEDGSEWPQGVFLFSDVSRFVFTQDVEIGALNLVDQLLIVDQQLDQSFVLRPGDAITDGIIDLLVPLPVSVVIDPSGAVVSPSQEAISWPAGTSRLRVINELATQIGYHELFFDNDGIGQLHLMPNPDSAPDAALLNYPAGQRTYFGTVTKSTNLLELPNRFVVVNNGATDVPVFGLYDVPDTAPHSAVNRGFVISHVEQLQGINTNEDAQRAAVSLARSWRWAFETVEMVGPPDPRHDTYDVVNFEGTRYLELSWSLPLQEGSEMRHSLRRTYEAVAPS